MDGLDVEGFKDPGELGQFAFTVGMIDPEDAVLVGIESDWTPALSKVVSSISI